jgi:hypothetical protein
MVKPSNLGACSAVTNLPQFGMKAVICDYAGLTPSQSGAGESEGALRVPPHSKTLGAIHPPFRDWDANTIANSTGMV